MDLSSNTGEELFTVTTTNAQDVLIITSAGLSFIKSLMAVGTYSYFHIAFAILEFVCTGLALALFILQDYEEKDQDIYGEDINIYFLSFISACIIEWLDVLQTYQTVRSYKRLKDRVKRQELLELKKIASRRYTINLVGGLLMSAIVPLIAFSKAGWETDYFAPSGFSSENSLLLLIWVCIFVGCQGLNVIFATLNACNPEGFVKTYVCTVMINIIPLAAGQILVYIVLSRVSGREAGGLTYVTMINSLQLVEQGSETARHLVMYAAEHPSMTYLLLERFRELDQDQTGRLPSDDVRKQLQRLVQEGLLPEGATESIMDNVVEIDNNDQIDYEDLVNRMESLIG